MFERGAGLEGEGQEGRSVELSPGLDRADTDETLNEALTFSIILLLFNIYWFLLPKALFLSSS